ncbi:hypothetical protein GN956_G25942 [Arapaima gigas]
MSHPYFCSRLTWENTEQSQFVERHIDEISRRLKTETPIEDALFSQHLISRKERNEIRAAEVDHRGCAALCRELQLHQAELFSQLEQADIVGRNLDEIIKKRVKNIGAVEDALFSQGLLSSEKLGEIRAAEGGEGRWDTLYWSLDDKGRAALYAELQLHEPQLFSLLQHIEFVNENREQIIQKVEQVQPMADSLLSQGLISREEYRKICSAGTSKERMTELYGSLWKGGLSVRSVFYWLLLQYEPKLFRDLERSQFIHEHMGEISKKVNAVEPKASATHSPGPSTKKHYRQELFAKLDEGGSSVKSEFYELLLQFEPAFVSDLGT